MEKKKNLKKKTRNKNNNCKNILKSPNARVVTANILNTPKYKNNDCKNLGEKIQEQ